MKKPLGSIWVASSQSPAIGLQQAVLELFYEDGIVLTMRRSHSSLCHSGEALSVGGEPAGGAGKALWDGSA